MASSVSIARVQPLSSKEWTEPSGSFCPTGKVILDPILQSAPQPVPQQLTPSNTPHRTRFALSRDLLDRLAPLLKDVPQSTFLDLFFDTPTYSLLIEHGSWLLVRRYLSSSRDPMWKLRVSIDVISDNTRKWREHIGRENISEVLRASQLPFDDLLKHYGHGYLQIYTKRYELSPLLWVDFVGWHIPSNPDASTIYAVCSYQHNASEVLDAAFSVLATHLNEDAPSKTKTMLAHACPELFQKAFPGEDIAVKILHSRDEFKHFDKYFGIERWVDMLYQCSDGSENSDESDGSSSEDLSE